MDKQSILKRYGTHYRSIGVGSYVVVTDGSFMLSTNQFSPLQHNYKGLSDEIFVVIMVNQPCPTEISDSRSLSVTNNCVIRSLVDNEISFCSEINLTPIEITKSDFSNLDENNISRELIRESNLNKVLGE